MEHQPTPQEPRVDRDADEFFEGLETFPEFDEAHIRDRLKDDLKHSYLETLVSDGRVNSRQARLSAHLLSGFIHESLPALRTFARTGRGDAAALRAEYSAIRNCTGSSDAGLFSDLLGTHLFHRDHPETAPPASDGELSAALVYIQNPDNGFAQATALQTAEPNNDNILARMKTLMPLLDRYGDAFRAYLRLPGINADNPSIEEDYLKAFGGGINPEEVDVLRIHGPDGPIQYSTVEVGGIVYAFIR